MYVFFYIRLTYIFCMDSVNASCAYVRMVTKTRKFDFKNIMIRLENKCYVNCRVSSNKCTSLI